MKKILRTLLITTTLVGCATHQNTAQARMGTVLKTSGQLIMAGLALYGATELYQKNPRNISSSLEKFYKKLQKELIDEKAQLFLIGCSMTTPVALLLGMWFVSQEFQENSESLYTEPLQRAKRLGFLRNVSMQ